jgi:hypothetical protein
MKIRGGIRIEGPKEFMGRIGWGRQSHCWPFAHLVTDAESLKLIGPFVRLRIPNDAIRELIVARRPWTALRIVHSADDVPSFVLFVMFKLRPLIDQMKASGHRLSEIDRIPKDWWNPRHESNSEQVGAQNPWPAASSSRHDH